MLFVFISSVSLSDSCFLPQPLPFSSLSLPPSLADTVSVSRGVLGLSGWPLFLLHSFIIPRVRPSLIFVQSVAKYLSNTSFVIPVDRRRVADLPKRLLNVMLNAMGVSAIERPSPAVPQRKIECYIDLLRFTEMFRIHILTYFQGYK